MLSAKWMTLKMVGPLIRCSIWTPISTRSNQKRSSSSCLSSSVMPFKYLSTYVKKTIRSNGWKEFFQYDVYRALKSFSSKVVGESEFLHLPGRVGNVDTDVEIHLRFRLLLSAWFVPARWNSSIFFVNPGASPTVSAVRVKWSFEFVRFKENSCIPFDADTSIHGKAGNHTVDDDLLATTGTDSTGEIVQRSNIRYFDGLVP